MYYIRERRAIFKSDEFIVTRPRGQHFEKDVQRGFTDRLRPAGSKQRAFRLEEECFN